MKKYLLSIFLFLPLTIMANGKTEEQQLLLLFTLGEKQIKGTVAFNKLVQSVPDDLLFYFYKQANNFFLNLNPSVPQTTELLTTMLNNDQQYIYDFSYRNEQDIAYLASLEHIESLAVMYRGAGFPQIKDIQPLIFYPQWYNKDGHFFNHEFFASFASIHSGNGCPTLQNVEHFLLNPENYLLKRKMQVMQLSDN